MEQYKFRGKSLETGEWLVGSLYDDGGEEYIIPNIPGSAIDYELYQVDGNTTGMFSGLKDIHENEIFKGDILHVCEYRNDFIGESMEFREAFGISELKGKFWKEYTDEVVFNEGCFSVKDTCLFALFGDQRHSDPIFEFEVIGNIYDNPELLKQKNKK